MKKCNFPNCSRELGHTEDHGHEITPGLILAPYGGGEGKLLPPEISMLACDCCSAQMYLSRYSNGGGSFKCSKCNQIHTFSKESHTSAVLARLYPSNMREGSKIHREFLEYRRAEWKFNNTARYLCGLQSYEEMQTKINEGDAAIDEKLADLVSAKPPWWKFWAA